MAAPSGFCEAFVTISGDFNGNVQYLIGGTPITNSFSLIGLNTAGDIQNAINANIIVAGVTITVTSFTNIMGVKSLTVSIQKASEVQITDTATAVITFFGGTDPGIFICNLAPASSGIRGGAGGLGFIPAEFIKVLKERFPQGAPEIISFRGITYYYVSEDEINFYYSKNKS